MEQEKKLKLLKEFSGLGVTALLLAVAFFNVSFPDSEHGYKVESGESLDKLSEPERLLAEKLLGFGLNISHEKRQIKLDTGIKTNRKIKHQDDFKRKDTTSPDFYFHYQGIDCFLEVGSHRQNAHKREQQAVVKEAITFKNGKKILYVQLFHGDISHICQEIGSVDELIEYLYSHPSAVFANVTL